MFILFMFALYELKNQSTMKPTPNFKPLAIAILLLMSSLSLTHAQGDPGASNTVEKKNRYYFCGFLSPSTGRFGSKGLVGGDTLISYKLAAEIISHGIKERDVMIIGFYEFKSKQEFDQFWGSTGTRIPTPADSLLKLPNSTASQILPPAKEK